jgi:hypothetical protein
MRGLRVGGAIREHRRARGPSRWCPIVHTFPGSSCEAHTQKEPDPRLGSTSNEARLGIFPFLRTQRGQHVHVQETTLPYHTISEFADMPATTGARTTLEPTATLYLPSHSTTFQEKTLRLTPPASTTYVYVSCRVLACVQSNAKKDPRNKGPSPPASHPPNLPRCPPLSIPIKHDFPYPLPFFPVPVSLAFRFRIPITRHAVVFAIADPTVKFGFGLAVLVLILDVTALCERSIQRSERVLSERYKGIRRREQERLAPFYDTKKGGEDVR